MKNRLILPLLALAFLLSPLPVLDQLPSEATAKELTLLSRQKCELTRSWINVYTYNFSALPEQEGRILGTLLIQNGSPALENQVRSAFVWVNHRLLLTPRDLEESPVQQVRLKNLRRRNRLTLVMFGDPGSFLTLQVSETGPSGPIFSGPQQQPFVCRTEASNLGQPLVDNYEGKGVAVYEEAADGDSTETLAGYCKDCNAVTRVDYYYRSADDGKFYPLSRYGSYPADLAYTTTNEGLTVPYIVRLERGSINRFIYGIAILDPWKGHGRKEGRSLGRGHGRRFGDRFHGWNGKLFYRFSGGVAIGHDQGAMGIGSPLYHEALSRGYAVLYSTGNRTGVHYNLQLAGETAIMVKRHFVKRFGEPEFTMSIGGSGGAIQQYVFAQNFPGLLDGIIPQRSYSDMITQTIYVGDCMLMEFYFDVVAPMQGEYSFGGFSVNPETGDIIHIGSPEKRSLIEGLSASAEEPHPVYSEVTDKLGSTECVNGWLGLTPLVMNPLFSDVGGLEQFPDKVVRDVKWTHWDDLKNIYGVEPNGHAPSTWDNVGVQYGLEALKNQDIALERFLDINARIGGWKKPWEMVPEGFPFSEYNTIQYLLDLPVDPADFDPWSIRNSNFSMTEAIAPRTQGNIEAMHAAYESGHVFIGNLDIPAIDIRDYLDPVLDMHHAQQSFATRQRIIEYKGSADNHLIWFKDPLSDVDITAMAIDLMDQWLTNIKSRPWLSISENKPAPAVDQCFCADGSRYQGEGVWDGILNEAEKGPCTEAFPLYSTSRIIAGGDIKGDVFKCHLIPVEKAIDRDFYGDVVIEGENLELLKAIFPDGVCDYSKGDAGRPADL